MHAKGVVGRASQGSVVQMDPEERLASRDQAGLQVWVRGGRHLRAGVSSCDMVVRSNEPLRKQGPGRRHLSAWNESQRRLICHETGARKRSLGSRQRIYTASSTSATHNTLSLKDTSLKDTSLGM